MSRLLILIVAAAAVVAGCGERPSGPRYQIARVDDGAIVRLDTHTGDMRRFVIVIGGDVAAPSQLRAVHEAGAVKDCDALGYVGLELAREGTAMKGGDTILYGKSKAETDEAWAYRCSKVAPSVTR